MIRKIMPMALPLVLGACQTAQPSLLPDMALLMAPANPTQSIRNTHQHGVVTDYTHREPVEPKPWRQLNDEQAPNGGAGS